jgi:hypothetical protein
MITFLFGFTIFIYCVQLFVLALAGTYDLNIETKFQYFLWLFIPWWIMIALIVKVIQTFKRLK